MTTDIDTQEILKRLKALEEENQRLKKKVTKEPDPITVTEGEYKGFPILTFQGSFRQFSVGLRKLKVIEEAWPQVKKLLGKHRTPEESSNQMDEDDFKI